MLTIDYAMTRLSKFAASTLILVSLLALTFTVGPVKAEFKTITVPDDYPTITAAINSASNSDTIYVKRGTYPETLTINKALSLVGEDKETTIINGRNSGTVVLIRHDNVKITGFTIMYDATANSPKSLWMWSTRLAGIHILGAKNCDISDNKVLDCGGGIWLYDSKQNIIADNYVFRNDYGIRVEASSNNTFSGNTVTGNWGGLWLISASSNKFNGNNMADNVQNFGITSSEHAHFMNEVDSSNTVNNKPIYYWINVKNQAVPSDAGCVVLVNCENMQIQGLRLSKNKDGLVLVDTKNMTVRDNVITESGNGIAAYNSLGDTINGNNINANTGITLSGEGAKILSNIIFSPSVGAEVNGSYHTVAGNIVTTNQDHGFMIKSTGSYINITRNTLNGRSYTYATIDGSNNVFYENVMTNSYDVRINGNENIIAKNNVAGITISDGSRNVVCGNKITNGLGLAVYSQDNACYGNQIENNYYVGISIGTPPKTSGNSFYHNNFIDNKQQIKNFGGNQANSWDNGSEGNYWSDYNGSDLAGDGIGDTPYFIKGEKLDEELRRMVEVVSGQDNYPLMKPFDVDSVVVTLPEWNYSMPEPSPAPTPAQSPTPTSTSTPLPSITPTPTSSPSPTESPPNLSPSPVLSEHPAQPTKNKDTLGFPAESIYAAIIVFVVTVILVVFAFRRRR